MLPTAGHLIYAAEHPENSRMTVQNPSFSLTLRRLEQNLRQLRRDPAPRHIHRFRTASKRLEALLTQLPDPSKRSMVKLAKSLKKFRRQAGRVRDLDMHGKLLREIHVPGEASLVRRLRRDLSRKRRQAHKKLEQELFSPACARLRRRLRRLRSTALQPLEPRLSADAVRREFIRLLASQPRIEAGNLHAFRKQSKQLQFIGEMDVSPASLRTTATLRRLHAAIGRWHDWAELHAFAAAWPPAAAAPRLRAALHGITQTQLHRALLLTEEIRREFSAPVISARRPPHGVTAMAARRISA